MRASSLSSVSVPLVLCLALTGACHSGDDDHSGSAGAPATGGTATATGGSAPSSGGTATATGGSGTGGSTGGTATGGSSGTSSATGGSGPAAGGSATGGSSTGGTATGGTAMGGSGTGGSATGGSSGTSSTTGGSAGTSSTTGGSAGTSSTGGSSGAAAGGSFGTSAGGSAGTGANPCDTALFCDDFESYTSAPSGKWAVRTTSGAVAIDTSQHVSGTQSVKFTTQSASSATAFMRIQDASIFPVPNNVIYGRMMFRVESEPTQSVHWTIVDGLGLVPGQTYHSEYRYGGQMPVTNGSQLMANYETPDWYSDKTTPGSDCWHHSNGRVIPAATWTCVEWEFDGANNGMQMWLNGTLADDLTIMGHGDGCVNNASDYTWTAPSFSSIDLGWESYQQDDPRTAYIDDVVLSTTRIGCP